MGNATGRMLKAYREGRGVRLTCEEVGDLLRMVGYGYVLESYGRNKSETERVMETRIDYPIARAKGQHPPSFSITSFRRPPVTPLLGAFFRQGRRPASRQDAARKGSCW